MLEQDKGCQRSGLSSPLRWSNLHIYEFCNTIQQFACTISKLCNRSAHEPCSRPSGSQHPIPGYMRTDCEDQTQPRHSGMQMDKTCATASKRHTDCVFLFQQLPLGRIRLVFLCVQVLLTESLHLLVLLCHLLILDPFPALVLIIQDRPASCSSPPYSILVVCACWLIHAHKRKN